MHFNIKWPLFIICSLITLNSTASLNHETEKIREKIRIEYVKQTYSCDIDQLLKRQQTNGSWNDIDYIDTTRTAWQHRTHLDRLICMSLAYKQPGKFHLNTDLLKHIKQGLLFWYSHHFICQNWFNNKIGTPRQMLAIGYILDKELSNYLRNKIIETINIISIDDYPARPGGDRIQVASNQAKVMLYKRDVKGISKVLNIIENEAKFAPMEEIMYDASGGLDVRNQHRPAGRGVQCDYSFHHRGDRVNSTLTYGLELPEYYSYWAEILEKTSFQFSTTHTQFVIDYYLDGVCKQLINWKQIEPSAFNRDICRRNAQFISPDIAQRLLNIANGHRDKELKQALLCQQNKDYISRSFAKFFWCSEYFIFQRPKYASAVRMHSIRNMNMEYPHNGEGIKNHFRGDGACYLSVTGNEYTSTPPVYDFIKIPGTTTLLLDSIPPATEVQKEGKSIFVGAVTDNMYGAVSFDFISPHYDLKAKKSWFFFDEGYVCLGNNISSNSNDTVVTTVEQCQMQGRVIAKTQKASITLPNGSYKTKNIDWILHNNNGYLFIDNKNIRVSNKMETGKWSNCVISTSYPKEEIALNMFSIEIMHGVNPSQGQYAYAIIPGTNEKQMNQYLSKPFFHIIANNPEVQAVENANHTIVYITFYQAGKLLLTEQKDIKVSQPCMLIIKNEKLFVSDPSRRLDDIKIEYNGSLIELALPTWQYAGMTIPVDLTKYKKTVH